MISSVQAGSSDMMFMFLMSLLLIVVRVSSASFVGTAYLDCGAKYLKSMNLLDESFEYEAPNNDEDCMLILHDIREKTNKTIRDNIIATYNKSSEVADCVIEKLNIVNFTNHEIYIYVYHLRKEQLGGSNDSLVQTIQEKLNHLENLTFWIIYKIMNICDDGTEFGEEFDLKMNQALKKKERGCIINYINRKYWANNDYNEFKKHKQETEYCKKVIDRISEELSKHYAQKIGIVSEIAIETIRNIMKSENYLLHHFRVILLSKTEVTDENNGMERQNYIQYMKRFSEKVFDVLRNKDGYL